MCSERLLKGRDSLDLPLQHGAVREAAGVRNDKVPLVPRRVVPHVFFQEALHKLQLLVPQFVLLRSQRDSEIGAVPQPADFAPVRRQQILSTQQHTKRWGWGGVAGAGAGAVWWVWLARLPG